MLAELNVMFLLKQSPWSQWEIYWNKETLFAITCTRNLPISVAGKLGVAVERRPGKKMGMDCTWHGAKMHPFSAASGYTVDPFLDHKAKALNWHPPFCFPSFLPARLCALHLKPDQACFESGLSQYSNKLMNKSVGYSSMPSFCWQTIEKPIKSLRYSHWS